MFFAQTRLCTSYHNLNVKYKRFELLNYFLHTKTSWGVVLQHACQRALHTSSHRFFVISLNRRERFDATTSTSVQQMEGDAKPKHTCRPDDCQERASSATLWLDWAWELPSQI